MTTAMVRWRKIHQTPCRICT